MRRRLLILVYFVPSVAAAQLQYNLVELRLPAAEPHFNAFAQPIDDKGTVGGEASLGNGTGVPCLWTAQGFVALPKSTYEYGTVRDISPNGLVSGNLANVGFGRRGALWQNGALLQLGNLPGYPSDIVGWGVNTTGRVVGHSFNAQTNRSHAFQWNEGAMIDLGDLQGGRDDSWANAINVHGVIVGGGHSGESTEPVAWNSNIISALGLPLTFTSGEAMDINDAGSILCLVRTPLESWSAVLKNSTWQLIHYGSSFSTVFGQDINCADQVTGVMEGPGTREPFIWDVRTGLVRLLASIEDATGWTDITPMGINNKGQMSGWGFFTYDSVRNLRRKAAFRLDPVTTLVPPTSFTVVYGQKQSGNAASLVAVDGDALRVCRFFVPNQQTDPVQVRVEANLPWEPMNLWLKATAKSTTGGAFTWSLNLYNWQTGLYDPSTNVTSPLASTYTSQETIAKGDISRYWRASDRKVWALLRARTTGPTTTLNWCVAFDQAVWEAVPMP